MLQLRKLKEIKNDILLNFDTFFINSFNFLMLIKVIYLKKFLNNFDKLDIKSNENNYRQFQKKYIEKIV